MTGWLWLIYAPTLAIIDNINMTSMSAFRGQAVSFWPKSLAVILR